MCIPSQPEQQNRVTGLQTAVCVSQEAQEKYMHAVKHKAEQDQVVGDENATHAYHQWCPQQS